MKKLHQELDELLNTIKYADDEDTDYLENYYFEDIVEMCKEIVELYEDIKDNEELKINPND